MLLSNYVKFTALSAMTSMTGASVGRASNQVTIYKYLPNINQYEYAYCLDVGFSDTDPTAADIILGDSNFSNRKLTCVSQTGSNGTGSVILSVTGTFRNDGESPVTVKEIGLFHATKNYNQTVQQGSTLIARSILETPITIGVGETYAFTYNIEI